MDSGGNDSDWDSVELMVSGCMYQMWTWVWVWGMHTRGGGGGEGGWRVGR